MGITTNIEWADSTLNMQMGCDGCELWNPAAGVKDCYAGIQTNIYAGPKSKGYPEAFDKPKLFTYRLDEAEKWKDLRGTKRPDKPWLDGFPRLIFLNDMGDTFTESLPIDWLAPFLPRMAAMPAIIMLLTKRANRMLQFSQHHPFPKNFWLMTTVTSAANYNRIEQLLQCQGGSVRGISYEPAFGEIDLDRWLPCLNWVIAGGMSGGSKSKSSDINWFRKTREQCRDRAAYFFKQGGTAPKNNGELIDITDRKGGNLDELPSDLNVREFPIGKRFPRGI